MIHAPHCKTASLTQLQCWRRFCRSRFFGDSELFIHMQSAHEQCFLCKRAHPDRYIYYKDYTELEGDLFTNSVLLCRERLMPTGSCAFKDRCWFV